MGSATRFTCVAQLIEKLIELACGHQVQIRLGTQLEDQVLSAWANADRVLGTRCKGNHIQTICLLPCNITFGILLHLNDINRPWPSYEQCHPILGIFVDGQVYRCVLWVHTEWLVELKVVPINVNSWRDAVGTRYHVVPNTHDRLNRRRACKLLNLLWKEVSHVNLSFICHNLESEANKLASGHAEQVTLSRVVVISTELKSLVVETYRHIIQEVNCHGGLWIASD